MRRKINRTQSSSVDPQPILPGQRPTSSQSMKNEVLCYRVGQSHLQVHRKAAFKQSCINQNRIQRGVPKPHFMAETASPKPHFMVEVPCHPERSNKYADRVKIHGDKLSIRYATMGSVTSASHQVQSQKPVRDSMSVAT